LNDDKWILETQHKALLFIASIAVKSRLALGKTINEDCFIQKPIKTEDLIKKLTSLMNI
jgi:hypothetical protein